MKLYFLFLIVFSFIVVVKMKKKYGMLYMRGKTQGGKDFQGGDPLFLYMPNGSNELKVW